MSAYICHPQHIGRLAAYLARRGQRDPERVALILASEILRSVSYRYRDEPFEELPGPGVCDNELDYRVLCVQAAHRLWTDELGPAAVYKMATCYEYQSCEHPGWKDSEARSLVWEIKDTAARSLPGYEDAPWHYTGPEDHSARRREIREQLRQSEQEEARLA